eukprot:EG_transcript_37091
MCVFPFCSFLATRGVHFAANFSKFLFLLGFLKFTRIQERAAERESDCAKECYICPARKEARVVKPGAGASVITLVKRFGTYTPDDPTSLRLESDFTLFPVFMYHLRRSEFLQ